jgi:hypothetical protein
MHTLIVAIESFSEQNRGRKGTAGVSSCSENVAQTLFWLMVVFAVQNPE